VSEVLAGSPSSALRSRLDDPEVAAALSVLLDNADVLALLIQSVDGLLRRADVISASLESGLDDVRTLAGSAGYLVAPTKRLIAEAPAIADTADALLESGIFNRDLVNLLAKLGNAALAGHEAAQRKRTSIDGIREALRTLKDPEVARGLGLMVEIARALGRSV
jgi:uncharacterized protein YjgD (DUF1641 family)